MAPGKTREQQKKRDKGKAVSPPEPCAYCKADDATLPCKGCGQVSLNLRVHAHASAKEHC